MCAGARRWRRANASQPFGVGAGRCTFFFTAQLSSEINLLVKASLDPNCTGGRGCAFGDGAFGAQKGGSTLSSHGVRGWGRDAVRNSCLRCRALLAWPIVFLLNLFRGVVGRYSPGNEIEVPRSCHSGQRFAALTRGHRGEGWRGRAGLEPHCIACSDECQGERREDLVTIGRRRWVW